MFAQFLQFFWSKTSKYKQATIGQNWPLLFSGKLSSILQGVECYLVCLKRAEANFVQQLYLGKLLFNFYFYLRLTAIFIFP